MKIIIITALIASIAVLPAYAQENQDKQGQTSAPEGTSETSAPKNTSETTKSNVKKAPDTPPENNAPVQVKSLRQGSGIRDSVKVGNKKWVNNDKIVPRQYIQQPPMIPHNIENYKITIRSNMCLRCHSWEAAQYTGATKISLTHFKDRDGSDMSEVSPRRYFCTQCHVPQVSSEPLIENDYQKPSEVKPNK